MSFAFLPLYTGDYLRDTQHLSCAEHGIYIKLIIHCWDQRGPAPIDERKLLGIVNARSGDEIEALRRVLLEFFTQMDDGWYNKRIQMEIERAANISLKRKSAGAKGYQARAKHLLSKSQASASTLTTTTTTTTTSKSKEKDSLSVSASPKPDIASQSREVLEYLNRLTGRKFRAVPETLKPIQARLKSGFSVARLQEIAFLKNQQWGKDERMAEYLRPKTLYTATNCANYDGVLPNGVDDE